MILEGQGILEGQSTQNDTLSKIMGAVKGLAEVVMAQAESNKMVL